MLHVVQRMHRVLPVALMALAGCVSAYTPPRPDEPHAVAKIRVAYHASAGTGLHQVVTVDGHPVEVAEPVPGTDGTATSATLVRPVDTTWEISSEFFHLEMRQVMETYYTTEYYSCMQGFGQHAHMGSCSRQVSHQRWVSRSVPVTDMACTTGVRQIPRVGAVYLLQYDFYGQDRCTLACLEQIPTGPQTFRMAPCGGPPAVTSGGHR